MIRVFFEKTGVAELAAVFTDERLYKDCLPAIQRIAKDQGFDKVTELYEDSIASDIITDTLSQKDFLPVINR